MWLYAVCVAVTTLHQTLHAAVDFCPRKVFGETPDTTSSNHVITSVVPSTVDACHRLCRQYLGCTSFHMVWSTDGWNHRCQLLQPVKGTLAATPGTSFYLSCPAGMSYYSGACYQLVMTSKTWDDALAHCPSLHSEAALVDVQDTGEWDFIRYLCINGGATSTWVGGKRPAGGANDEFYWASSGARVTFTNWAASQPAPYYSDHNCILSRLSESWGWNDKECSLAKPFVCKL